MLRRQGNLGVSGGKGGAVGDSENPDAAGSESECSERVLSVPESERSEKLL